jgi:lipopolysaccharide transport system ATP-binding protein
VKNVIVVENVSVAYKFYNKPSDFLRETLFGGERHDSFWALRDVSLEIKEGERVGIVGPNGAGKSTLLKVIAGNLSATSGKVSVDGKISSLLSVVPAWNEEMTGIENIRFNLLLQGVPQNRIDSLIEDIADFTELGPFLLHPVKTYSSGMGARLSFGIATATEPEILIVDEVLGVGDGYFAAKAARRMNEFCARGKALLFVSHSTAAVQQMCNRVVWLDHGTIRMRGEAAEVLQAYELDFRLAEDQKVRSQDISLAAVRASMPFRSTNRAGGLRFRIVPADQERVGGTYYIRSIRMSGVEPETIEVPLTDVGDDASKAGLDVFDSEWGRLFDHRGDRCRQLSNNSARLRGGHFIVPLPTESYDEMMVTAEIESDSSERNKRIELEYYDFYRNSWEKAKSIDGGASVAGWTMNHFQFPMRGVSPTEVDVNVSKMAELLKSEVMIESVELFAGSIESRVFRERQPFEVRITLNFREPVDKVDVGMKISRADGAYAFWQTSGQVGQNICRTSSGRCICAFQFEENVFGSGEYTISVALGNGWSHPDNYPYSRIYHRVIDVVRFRVSVELEGVDFGIVNVRVPVQVSHID